MSDQMQRQQYNGQVPYDDFMHTDPGSGSTANAQPPLETLQYYYNYIDSDDAVYWDLKDEFKNNLEYPRTYLVTSKPQNKTSKPKGYICFISCPSAFTRKADLERHIATTHKPDASRFDCPLPKCHRTGEDGFTREDHLKEHLRNFHHRDVPKRGGRQ